MSIPDFKTVWTRYLFNQDTPPDSKELLEERLIRGNKLTGNEDPKTEKIIFSETFEKGSPFKISAPEFMKNGPGKFVNGAVFSIVQNFFITPDEDKGELKLKLSNHFLRNNAHRGQTDENGSLSFDLKTMLALNEWITSPKSGFSDEPNKGRNISQSHFRPEGESNYEFSQRVQLFQSTYFQIGSAQDIGEAKNYDEHVKFVLHADGSREIKNFVVTPREKKDNFDFFGGNDEVTQKTGNEINDFITDPSNTRYDGSNKTFGIGRTVPYEYIDTDKIPRITSYTQEHYAADRRQLKLNQYKPNMSYTEKAKVIKDLWNGSLQMYKEMYQAGIISFEDEQGRSVYYGSNDADSINLDIFPVRNFIYIADLLKAHPDLSLPFLDGNLSSIEKDRLNNLFNKSHIKKQITFVAGAGDDVIKGLNGPSTLIELYSPEHNDRILGGKGNDKLYGRRGNDQLQGDEGDDLLDGGEGNDSLDGGAGLDTYYIQEHDVVKDSDGGGKIIFNSKHSLTEITASRFMRGDADPADTWFSVNADGKRDAELLATRVGDDLKIARGGSDSVLVKSFFTLVQGSATGNMANALGISLEDEQPKNADGTGLIQQAGHASRFNIFFLNSEGFEITGGAKADAVHGSSIKASIIRTGAGNDRVFGGFHADVIEGGEGNDMLNGSAYVGAGTNRSLEQQALDADTLIGGAGSDLINGMAGDDTIHTGERGEHLAQVAVDAGGDWANGGLGKDKVYGSRGHDFLLGGEDSDWLYGGAGDDVLVGDGFIRAGWRSHTIHVENTIDGGSYVPGQPFHPIVPPGIGGGEYVPPTISQPVLTSEYSYRNGKWDLQTLNIALPTHKETFDWNVSISRDAGDYSLNAKLKPLNNDHRLAEGGAADYLFGGTGNDLIIGQDGNDYLQGEGGDDILWGDDNRNLELEGNDYLDGGEGNDQLRGGKGNDILVAGAGSDTLYGGEGQDAYLFMASHLQNSEDVNILKDSDGKGYIAVDGFALNQLHWEADKTQPNQWHNQQRELTLEQKGSELIISGKKFAATIKVQDYQKGALGLTLHEASTEPDTDTNPDETLPPLQPDTGDEVQGNAIIYGSVDNDTLVGTAADNTLNGLGGDDVIHAGAGNDQVFGEAGNDTLHGDAGDDHLYGGEGADTLYGWDGADLLNGENGNDQLYGGAGADTLFGWHGNDALHGDAGNDALYGGEGSDTLYGWADDDQLFGDAGNDRLFGGAGHDALHGWTGDDELHGDAGNDHLYGGAGADALYGWDDDDQLYGDAGKDVLAGGAGNDILAGGQGDDQLFGGVGSDVYVFLNGDGDDLIVEDNTDRTAVDVVQLRGLASTDAYALSRVGDDLHLSYAQQRIVVRDQFAEQGFAIEELHFSDGVVLGAQDLSQRVNLSTDAMGFVV